jgi:division protein CdvB (Snf7/Vps24/ESCRT-III family)
MTSSKWVKSESVLNQEDIAVALPKPGGPLKPRLDAVHRRIQVQIAKLEEVDRLQHTKDEDAMKKLASAIKDNNIQYCAVLSSELSKDRQVSRVLELSKVALEKLATKLVSVSDFADLVVILSPAMAVVKNLRSSLSTYIPEMENDLGIISELLSGILVDAGQVGGYTINFETANEEAIRLIDEASLAVDQKMKEEFPGIPDLSSPSPQMTG